MKNTLKIIFTIFILAFSLKVNGYNEEYLREKIRILEKQKTEIEEINRTKSAWCYQTNYSRCSNPISTYEIDEQISNLEKQIYNLREYEKDKNQYNNEIENLKRENERERREFEEKYQKLKEEMEYNLKIKPFYEKIDKNINNFKILKEKKLENLTKNEIQIILDNLKNIFKNLENIEKSNNQDYDNIIKEVEFLLEEKIFFDKFQEYIKNGNKLNFKDLNDFKKFITEFENLKNNKESIKKQLETAKNYIKSHEIERGINSYKHICYNIKLFECYYNISLAYKQEMLGYSENYNSSNKEENFEKNKKEAIKNLEIAIFNYNKDLFLDKIDISKIEKELQEIKDYQFKGNKNSDKKEEKIEKKEEIKENKITILFFERLENLTKNYSEKKKKELYNLLILKLDEFKTKDIKKEIKNSLDEIIFKLKQKI